MKNAGKWIFTPLGIALVSLIFYHLALPPVGWWPLVFLAPILWVPLIQWQRRPEEASATAPPRRRGFWRFAAAPFRAFGRFVVSFYGQLWCAATLFWGATVLWIGFPHPALWIAWVALSGWLAIYFPIFIGASRILVDRFHVPIVFAPAIVWIGTEWFRKHLLGGFSFGSLEHTLYLRPELIQTADLIGEYGVGALIVFIGTLVGVALFSHGIKKRAAALLGAAMVFALIFWQGARTLEHCDVQEKAASDAQQKPFRIALLQDGEYLTYPIPEETNLAIHSRYMTLSGKAADQFSPLDLIIWPEGTFARPFFEFCPGWLPPGMENLSPEALAEQLAAMRAGQERPLFEWATRLGTPVVLGGSTTVLSPDADPVFYNSALFITPNDNTASSDSAASADMAANACQTLRYDKRQRVMFGEYIPLVEFLPDAFPLKTLCVPIAAGTRSGLFPVGSEGTALMTICFESSIPHFINGAVESIRREGKKLDFIVSISNDGWFRGAAENELHTATYVFRAIESRVSLLAATHGGTSLWIDPVGRIRATGIKGETEIVPVELPRVAGTTPFGGRGFYVPPICAVLVVLALLCGGRKRKTFPEKLE